MPDSFKAWFKAKFYKLMYSAWGLKFLVFLEFLAKVYQGMFPLAFAISPRTGTLATYWLWMFWASLVYSGLYAVISPKEREAENLWVARQVQRTQNLNSAIDRLHIDRNALDSANATMFFHEALLAIQSEVEQIVRDNDRTCINVTLLKGCATDDRYLEVVSRADQRQSDKRHRKSGFLGWQAMVNGRWQSIASGKWHEKPYRTILAIPIIDNSSQPPTPLGVICIDSTKPYHFREKEVTIRDRILPYISLLKLVLL